MSAVEDLSRRRGGREARRALRSRPIPMAEAAVRPGMEGGQYKPLTDRDMQRIHQTALKLLETVGIAQAIIHNPPVLILDEPTSGLDPEQQREARQLIASLSGDHTIILSTHILSEVEQSCSKVIIINKGQIVAVDSVANLHKRGTSEDWVAWVEFMLKVMREQDVKVIFTEPQFEPRLVRQLTRDLGIAFAELDVLETGPIRADFYVQGMRRNQRTLAEALK